jgi:hypothetical protein
MRSQALDGLGLCSSGLGLVLGLMLGIPCLCKKENKQTKKKKHVPLLFIEV